LSSHNKFEIGEQLQIFSSSYSLSNHNKTANREQVLSLQIMQSLSSHNKFEETKAAANICCRMVGTGFATNYTNFHGCLLLGRCSKFGQAFGQSFVYCPTSFVVS
jgi:hypothetical protein